MKKRSNERYLNKQCRRAIISMGRAGYFRRQRLDLGPDIRLSGKRVENDLEQLYRCAGGLKAEGVDSAELVLMGVILEVLGREERERAELIERHLSNERAYWFRRGWAEAVRRGTCRTA